MRSALALALAALLPAASPAPPAPGAPAPGGPAAAGLRIRLTSTAADRQVRFAAVARGDALLIRSTVGEARGDSLEAVTPAVVTVPPGALEFTLRALPGEPEFTADYLPEARQGCARIRAWRLRGSRGGSGWAFATDGVIAVEPTPAQPCPYPTDAAAPPGS